MATRLSRRKIAVYVATSLTSGRKQADVIRELAAYLIEARRLRELDLIIRDIEEALARNGVVVADVTSAHPLSDTIKKELASLVDGSVQFRESIDSSMLGGVRMQVPGKQFDGTLRRKLTALRAKQV